MTCHILAHAQNIRKLCVYTCGSESCEGKTRGKQTTSVTARHAHLWPVDPGSHWPSAVDWRRSSWYGTVYDDQEKNKIPPTPSDRSMKSQVQTPPDETCTLGHTRKRITMLMWFMPCGAADKWYLQQVFAKHIFKVCTSTPDEKDGQGRIVYRGCEGGPALVIFLFVLFFF